MSDHPGIDPEDLPWLLLGRQAYMAAQDAGHRLRHLHGVRVVADVPSQMLDKALNDEVVPPVVRRLLEDVDDETWDRLAPRIHRVIGQILRSAVVQSPPLGGTTWLENEKLTT